VEKRSTSSANNLGINKTVERRSPNTDIAIVELQPAPAWQAAHGNRAHGQMHHRAKATGFPPTARNSIPGFAAQLNCAKGRRQAHRNTKYSPPRGPDLYFR